MMQIELTQEKFTLVDDEDFEYLSEFKWYASNSKHTSYAMRDKITNGKKFNFCMHRVIMNVTDTNLLVDHKDGNGLNNTKENLRICNKSQNAQNRGFQINNKSGFKGVSWNKRDKKWEVRIKYNKKHIFVGYYDDVIEAALAYDVAALEYHGEFATLNFPIGIVNG